MIHYFVLGFCDILFGLQFLFNQKFQKKYGSSFALSMTFSCITSLFGFGVLFAANGFKISFSWFSAIIAAIYAVVGILYVIVGIKSFETVNLSAYSVFMMLGGMMLPSVYGIIFCNESLTVIKIACFALIIAAMFFEVDFKQKSGQKIYYAAVFVLNGLVGVLSVIHETADKSLIVDSISFLMIAKIMASVISFTPIMRKSNSTLKKIDVKGSFLCLGFAICSTLGNLLLLKTIQYVPASIQYPIVTGGTMLVSLLISVLTKEKIKRNEVAATLISFVATVLIAFQK